MRWKNIQITTPDGKQLWDGLPELPEPNPPVQSDRFVPLFNGKDLTGWKALPDQRNDWRVQDGVLIASGNPGGRLYTERADFGNFHLRAEARVSDQGAGGVVFRAPFGGLVGYQAMINSTHLDPARTGSLYAHIQGPSSESSGQLAEPHVAPGRGSPWKSSPRAIA